MFEKTKIAFEQVNILDKFSEQNFKQLKNQIFPDSTQQICFLFDFNNVMIIHNIQ